MKNMRKDIHTRIRLIAMLLIICVFAFMPAALADGGEVTPPEYATVTVSSSEVDINTLIEAFYGEQASELKLETEVVEANGMRAELIHGHLPDMESAFSYCESFVSMDRPYEIPLRYRDDGEGMYAPPPSKIAGKYTQDEAIELARSFIQDKLGIAKAGLVLLEVAPEDASKERSRAYRIVFTYAWNGIPLVGEVIQNTIIAPYINVGVTDEGIVEFSGNVLELSGGKQGGTELASMEKIKGMYSDRWAIAEAERMELCYKVGPAAEGRLAWGMLTQNCKSVKDTNAYCDAYTGESLT